ncbi:hypothetical protein M1819_006964 [Neofusicoccum parvum]|uniref:Uncharacterized protein n=1 Tax=Neofusicoccum parvum TaxID=310453 RepID=A0ACB5SQI0_9PEZI|nr:hypothetical protein M1819_006964 [Neofusicoccum parvum]
MSGTSSHHSHSSGSSYDPLAPFARVIAALCTDALPDLALDIRCKAFPNSHVPPSLTCQPTDHPITGAYNIVYELRFSDGVQWMLKVPKAGHSGSWDDSAASSLTTEVLAMKFLKRKTTIPLPTVYDFSAYMENRLNVPYILMEKITGVSLSDFWYDRNFTREERRSRNGRLLPELAAAMLQMNSFTFDKGGSPLFDSEDRISGVGPLRLKDFNDEFANILKISGDEGTSGDGGDYVSVFREVGPFSNAGEQLSWALHDRKRTVPASHKYIEGWEKMLELFVSWIPETDAPLPKASGEPHVPEAQHQAFVLSHADIDTQNIIVTNDGHLAGFIDWDGIAIVPRSLGNERYPFWLMHDWNPFTYFYDEDKDQVRPHSHRFGGGCCPTKDSPDDLAFYRNLYQSTITDLSKTILSRSDGNQAAADSADLEESLRRVRSLTMNSLIITSLELACSSRWGSTEIMHHIWERIKEVIGDDSSTDSSTEADGDSDEEPTTSQAADINTNSPGLSEDAMLAAVEPLSSESADGNKVPAKNDKQEQPAAPSDSSTSEDSDEQNEPSKPDEERDYGNFIFYDVAIALAKDTLDEERYRKLKDGFERLFV